MAEYQMKDMSGSLFPNDKGDNQARPDMRGTIMIDGQKYSLSAWNNESKAGKSYVSIKVSEFVERPESNGMASAPAAKPLDDEIPF
jgi:uncharacterized protein (DUF736 family)